MSAATLASPAVADFAAAVRSALSDLAPDEIDDLTDGLEADLTDRLADGDATELGDPAAYAEELRAAAGLPHRPTPRAGFAAELRHAPKIVAAAFREFGAAHPSLGRLRDFVVTLRPLWWVFRAAVITALIGNFTNPGWSPVNGFTLVVGIVALVISVQFGRGHWLPFVWMRGLLLAVNVALVIATPFIVAGLTAQVYYASYAQAYADMTANQPGLSGLANNGNQVSNIFAYDAQGRPLTNVQLFDQDGKPLNANGDPTTSTFEDGRPGILVPNRNVPGRPGWNVYPLGHVAAGAVEEDGTVDQTVTPTPAKLPFATVTPLAGSGVAPTPSPVPTSTPTPGP